MVCKVKNVRRGGYHTERGPGVPGYEFQLAY